MFTGKADKNQQESIFIDEKSVEFKVLTYTMRNNYLE